MLQMRLRHKHAADSARMKRMIRAARGLRELGGLRFCCLDQDDGQFDDGLQDAQLVYTVLRWAFMNSHLV